MLICWTYFKPDGHEWKNKKGFIHFLLLDIKWEQTQKYVENLVHKKDEGNVLGAGTLTTVTSYQLASHGITMTDALILKIILQMLRE